MAGAAVVIAAVLRNRDVIGMPIVAYGAACNLAAILANGGFMPASPSALASLGKLEPTAYSNSFGSSPSARLPAPLTDQFALPHWLPFANVYFGDMVIGIGVVFVIVAAMVRPRTDPNGQVAEVRDRHGGVPASRWLPSREPTGSPLRRSSRQPAARRGRKARDLARDRPAAGPGANPLKKEKTVKANFWRASRGR